MTRPRPRPRRLAALLAGGVLASVGLVVSAPSADAAPAPRTYTTSMSPTTAVPGQVVSYAVVVTNTSTKISALDRVILQIPSGFTVTPGAVTSPRGGWTESVGGGLLTASTPTPVKNGLRKGEVITIRFTAVDTVTCDTRKVTWVQKADGKVIDPFVPQSPNPTVQATPVADRFVVTSTTDVSAPTPGSQVVKNQAFSVGGEFRCGASLVAPTSGAGTVTLVKSGTSPSGSLGGTTSTSVGAGATTATISGATYDTVTNGVGLTADWNNGLDGTTSVDVLGAAATVDAVPGQPASLTVPGGSAELGAGANGAVALIVQACNPDETTCSDGTELSLAGSFKDAQGHPLYTFAAPASVTRDCAAADCPHQVPGQPGQEGESSLNYDYNYLCPGNSCDTDFDEREVEEDFAWYDTYISLRNPDGSYQPFKLAKRCVDLPSSYLDPNKSYLLTLTGTIQSTLAQNDGFCVDVNAITRTGNSFTGDLHIPVLFVEDPRIRP